MSLDGPMGATSVDSADQGSSGTFLDVVKAIAGTSYTVILDPRGALVMMSGLEEMREALRAQMPDPSGQAMLDSMLSDEALRSRWAQGGACAAQRGRRRRLDVGQHLHVTDSRLRVDDGRCLLPGRVHGRRPRRHRQLGDDVP